MVVSSQRDILTSLAPVELDLNKISSDSMSTMLLVWIDRRILGSSIVKPWVVLAGGRPISHLPILKYNPSVVVGCDLPPSHVCVLVRVSKLGLCDCHCERG